MAPIQARTLRGGADMAIRLGTALAVVFSVAFVLVVVGARSDLPGFARTNDSSQVATSTRVSTLQDVSPTQLALPGDTEASRAFDGEHQASTSTSNYQAHDEGDGEDGHEYDEHDD